MIADLALAFSTGLVGGFGHCLAMCGPLLVSFQLPSDDVVTPAGQFLRDALYHLGRICTYGALGLALGLSGSFVDMAGRLAGVQQAVAVLAGGLMVALGLSLTGAGRWLRSVEARLVTPVVTLGHRILELPGLGRFFALGLLLGLLPCGLSYTVLLGAAATGSPLWGALYALSFGLGTLPALLLLGVLTRTIGARLRDGLRRLGGALVVATGLWFALRGLGVNVAL